jgi:putative addiction module CopG family antidote
MSDSLTMTVKLSPEARKFIRSRVESGEYASEDEVLNEGVSALRRSEAEERDRFIREEVLPSIEEHRLNPSSSITADELMLEMAAWRAEREAQS